MTLNKENNSTLSGVLNINKPLGITSFDVVRKIKKLIWQKKVGHCGTLDPEASGVLPICIGKATKAIEFIMENNKEYIAKLKLGVTTDTYDREGAILTEKEVHCTPNQIIEVVNKFMGEIEQIPPMYSALKVNGKKLYELARQGIEVERAARKINIHNIEILSIELPFVEIKVNCSKGTYIRSLCYDIGESLGCGAMMWSLDRTATEPFKKIDSVDLEVLSEDNIKEYIIPLEEVFEDFLRLDVNEKFEKLLLNGVVVKDRSIIEDLEKFKKYSVYNSFGKIIGIALRTDVGLKLIKLFV